jgi:electron transfer flavoprotein alpha subunit
MPIVLIVAEQQPDGSLRKATLNTLAAGAQLAQKASAELHVAIFAKDASKLADELKGVAGVKAVHAASGAQFEHYVAEAFTPAVAELVQSLKADFVGAPSTAQGKDLMPRVAARLKAAMASDVMKFEGSGNDIVFTRPMWAGNVIADVKLATPIKAFTVRTTEFSPAEKGGSAEVRAFSPAAVTAKAKFVDFKEVKSSRPNLTEARVIVSGGRGTKGDFKEIEALADELGAAVGASRAVCDAGWVPNDLQVGQTGKVVAPQLYIAAGISGAIQHLAGMKGSKTIVAINKDPEAPIFQVADYGLVADLFKVLPELRAAIHSAK